DDERLARAAPPGGGRGCRRRLLLSRRGDPRRLAALLLVVRWPGRIAEPLALVRQGELEQPSQRAGDLVDAGRRVASLREARGRGGQSERRRIGVRHLVPG